jgi:cell wall-associated NlpC family hydrolase
MVTVTGEAEDRNARYALLASGGAVVAQHLAAPDAFEADFVAVAERFLEAPYVWGGKTALGLDCSGLVQIALAACGIAAPRDTDMQESLGAAADPAGGLRRGDLLFWKGHVAIATGPGEIVHANARSMRVNRDPADQAIARLAGRGLPLTALRRLGRA